MGLFDGIKDAIKNNLVEFGINKADEKIDGRMLTREVRGQVSDNTGDGKRAVRISRGPVFNFCKEMAEGCYTDSDDDITALQDLLPEITQWAADVKARAYPNG